MMESQTQLNFFSFHNKIEDLLSFFSELGKHIVATCEQILYVKDMLQN